MDGPRCIATLWGGRDLGGEAGRPPGRRSAALPRVRTLKFPRAKDTEPPMSDIIGVCVRVCEQVNVAKGVKRFQWSKDWKKAI